MMDMFLSATPPKLKVAIVGGGIAGLICAFALSKNPDIEVHVYEAAHQFSEIGAGIGMYLRVWNIIEDLGLADSLVPLVDDDALFAFHMRKSNSSEGLSFYDMHESAAFMTFHRAEFQQAVLKRLPPSCKTYLRKRLASVNEPDSMDLPVSLYFTDGTSATCDLLVGADGIKSAVRASMYCSRAEKARVEGEEEIADSLMRCVPPVWIGSLAYRGLVTREQLMSLYQDSQPVVCKKPMLYCGSSRHVVGYPVAKGKLVNVAAIITDPDLEGTPFDGPSVTTVPKEELLSTFQGFEEDVENLLHFIEKPARWAIHTVTPLPSFISKRVVLLGDAAHAMAPHQGAGAGQAIEDTYILASLLTHPLCTKEALPAALGIYDSIRRPLANSVLEGSRRAGLLYDFNLPGLTEEDIMREGGRQSMEVLHRVGKTMDTIHEWIWKRPVQKDKEQAVTMLEDRLSLGSVDTD
ncbi:salicylate hydroxylase [Neolentinus lepideus HHB14362 ss-1]|uniref:Salicylate hydroxylase n=1 Tax=Neolentinus lepideus HHB14362 ss-1 TaxID=1314782 RepID=A0A165VVP8_9AGAM|nr:salicylate hydroxylase [Neolentinus lepideus HHB14362 ss-1]